MDGLKRLEDAECAAIVLPSIFEEQITRSQTGRVRHMDPADAHLAQTLASRPAPAEYALTPDDYAAYVNRAKAAVKPPIIASMNGSSAESWLRFARVLEHAGADALELNLYEVATDLARWSANLHGRVRPPLAIPQPSSAPTTSRRSIAGRGEAPVQLDLLIR